MLRAFVRKTRADLKGRPLQTALLFIVVAAAAFTLSLALNVQSSASKPYERLRAESNGADLWLYFSMTPDLDALRAMSTVDEVSDQAYPVSWRNYGIRSGSKKQQVALVGMPPVLPEFDHPVVTNGRWLSAGGRDEIVLDRGAAQRLGLEVGQSIELLTPEGSRTFTVVGFAVPTGRAPAPIDDPAFVFMLPETLASLEPDTVFGTIPEASLRVSVRLVDSANTMGFAEQLGSRLLGANIRTWVGVRQSLEDANQFDVIFLNVFSIFALVAAGLIIANAVSGQVLSQVRDTGILKTIGFSPSQVTLALLFQNLVLALAASLAGMLAGLLVAPFFLARSAEVLGVPAAAAFDPVNQLIVLTVVSFLVLAFTFVPAWRGGRVSAVTALGSGSTGRDGGRSRLASLAGALHLPRVVVVGLKDLGGRPVRTAMTLAALVLAVVTATFSLGIEAIFRDTMKDFTAIGGPPYDLAVDRDALPDGEARRILESSPEVESYLAIFNVPVRLDRRGFELRGVDGDLTSPAWALREGRMPSARGEAAMSNRLAEELSLSVGDRLTLNIGFGAGTPVEVVVVGRYIDVDGGLMMVTAETISAFGETTDYLVATVDGTDNQAFASRLITASDGNLDPEVLAETITEIRDQFRPVLISLNAVLLLMAGINLLSSILLSVRERQRDFAILKTIGFTPLQVAGSVLSASAFLALAAVASGIPLGLVVARVVFDLLTSAAGIGTGVAALPGPLALVVILPGAVIVAGLATLLPARRAARIQVVEALRYE